MSGNVDAILGWSAPHITFTRDSAGFTARTLAPATTRSRRLPDGSWEHLAFDAEGRRLVRVDGAWQHAGE